MLEKVNTKRVVSEEQITQYFDSEQRAEIAQLVDALANKKILHINATSSGGGVAELLHSLIPYLNALSVDAEWYKITPEAGEKFFGFTNKLHNALQGEDVEFSEDEWERYAEVNEQIFSDIKSIPHDILMIHDPQPLLSGSRDECSAPKAYYSHIDTSTPQEEVWKRVQPWIEKYDRIVFSSTDFVNPALDPTKVRIFTPAIDPLTLKQKIVSREDARAYLADYGVSADGPLLVQVSRFDVWKNPFGVVEAFQRIQSEHPDAQLALVGFDTAGDNVEAQKVYKQVEQLAADVPNVHLFFHAKEGINVPEFTMMAQNAADIVVQNSTREGFGLVVSEAMWKGKPIIGGPASGVQKQILDGESGYIVRTVEGLAERMDGLLRDPEECARLGREAKKRVTEYFLFPRYALDHLRVYETVLSSKE